jgi:hypothetical protein
MEETRKISELIELGKTLRKQIQDKIKALPDNPRINRLGKNCFTMKQSDLGDNWTPEHHDFKRTYETICEKLESVKLENVEKALLDMILKEQVVTQNKNSKNRLNLHKDVIEHLKTIIPTKLVVMELCTPNPNEKSFIMKMIVPSSFDDVGDAVYWLYQNGYIEKCEYKDFIQGHFEDED